MSIFEIYLYGINIKGSNIRGVGGKLIMKSHIKIILASLWYLTASPNWVDGKNKITPRIQNGSDASQIEFENNFRSLGYLISKNSQTDLSQIDLVGEFRCAATLIDSRWVLTAAHCVDTYENGKWISIPPEHIEFILDRANLSNGSYLRRRVVSVLLHEDYGSSLGDADLALIELEEPVKGLRPMRLSPQSYFDFSVIDDDQTILALGWGWTRPLEYTANQNPPLSPSLKKVKLLVGSQEQCKETWSNLSAREMCSKSPNNTDIASTLPGDSGGPLLAQMTQNDFNVFTQVGITSFGNPYGTNSFAGFTRVSSYIPWIQSHICTGRSVNLTKPKIKSYRDGAYIKINIDPVENAEYYRIYFLMTDRIQEIRSIDLGPANFFEVTLPPDLSRKQFMVGIKAYQDNCSSDFSDLTIL
jgi:secreted trypsin-like serine protease